VLLAQPRVLLLLIDVHRTSEDENRAVVLERPRRGRAPGNAPFLEPVAARLDRVAEDACAHLLVVDDGQDVHQLFAPALTGTFAACSRRCSSLAFAAA